MRGRDARASAGGDAGGPREGDSYGNAERHMRTGAVPAADRPASRLAASEHAHPRFEQSIALAMT